MAESILQFAIGSVSVTIILISWLTVLSMKTNYLQAYDRSIRNIQSNNLCSLYSTDADDVT